MKPHFFLVMAMFTACQMPSSNTSVTSASAGGKADSMKNDLMQADKDFSTMSASKGRNTAFLAYIDPKGVMLRPNSMPVVGKDTVAKIFSTRADTGFTLTWSPLYADVAASGELGYTYGTYVVKSHTGESEAGTYCTIWKKDSDGKWKYVLDTGSPGLKAPTQQK